MKVSDEIVILEIRRRNRHVFKALFDDHYQALTRYAERFTFARQESEDIVQSLFIHIWENAESLSIDTSIRAYLFKAVRNRCLNFLRDLKVTDKHRLLYLEAMLSAEEELPECEPEIVKSVKAALGALPPEMAKIFDLKYLQGKRLVEIAQNLQISENTVKTQLLRAKEKLRKVLSEPAIHSY